MSKIDWHTPQTFSHDGLTFAYWESGPKDSAYPPIVFSHGFPELAYSWRHQMEALGEAGFYCIAMDQRGYGQSSCPPHRDDYTMAKLCGDLNALCAHLALESVIFCGHDWGGMIVWQMPLRYPSRALGVIALNTPYTKRAPEPPIGIYKRRFGEDFYIVWFQKDGEAEALMERDIAASLTYFCQQPERKSSEVDQRKGSSMRESLEHFDIKSARPRVMSDEDFDFYVEQFTRTGFRGPVNWYRNFDRNWHDSEGQIDRLTLPTLMIMAELDPVLPPSVTNGMERYVEDLEKTLITDSGHWTQQEQPEAVNAAIEDWVKRRFT